MTGLSFTYDGSYEPVFDNVTLRLDTDWRLGFVGRNGRGKTTFLKLLMGGYDYAGTIHAPVAFEYFPYEANGTERPAREVLSDAAGDAEEWRLGYELSLLGVEEEALGRPFAVLSGGEKTKVLLAALFCREERFLLIDEPTNHLDAAGRRQVAEYLAGKAGFILVSHDRAFLDRSVDHILALNRTGVEVQRGNFSSWWENKERRDAFEEARNEKLKGEIARLGAAARRTTGWSDAIERSKIGEHSADRGFIGHKSAKMMKRAKAIENRRSQALEEKSALLKDVERADDLAIHPLDYPGGLLAEAVGLSVDFGDGPLFEGLDLEVRRGERLALRGRNGSGKTTLLRLLAGGDLPHTGRFHRGSRLTVSVVQQDTAALSGGLRAYAESCGVELSLFLTILRKLDFSREAFDRDMAAFSQGQKKKVLIARSLSERAHLYLWDEPLNYIDVLSRMQIERLLTACAPTMVFIEHDEAFVDAVATRTVGLDG